jgi:hypothetical protein
LPNSHSSCRDDDACAHPNWLQQLADVDASLADKIGRDAYPEADHAAYLFFQRNLCRIEILRSGELERLYFPRPVISNYLTKLTKESFVWGVDRTSPQEKVEGLFNAAADFLDEMKHQVSLYIVPSSRSSQSDVRRPMVAVLFDLHMNLFLFGVLRL